MKKQYSKPGIIIENFSISQNIASGCNADHESVWGSPNHWSKNDCGWKDQWGAILWMDEKICTLIQENLDTPVGAICYNNPEGGMVVFSS